MSHHDHGPEAHEHKLSFWQKYIFSVDHKVIGIQYGITSLIFLLIGFSMMMLMRWQLAFPGQPLPWPWLANLFSEKQIMTVPCIAPSWL